MGAGRKYVLSFTLICLWICSLSSFNNRGVSVCPKVFLCELSLTKCMKQEGLLGDVEARWQTSWVALNLVSCYIQTKYIQIQNWSLLFINWIVFILLWFEKTPFAHIWQWYTEVAIQSNCFHNLVLGFSSQWAKLVGWIS